MCAAWSLGEGEVSILDDSIEWEGLLTDEDDDEALVLVLADALCPATPPAFVQECLDAAMQGRPVVAGSRPVTDTVKRVGADEVGDTVDRDALVQVTSPVVLGPDAVAVAAKLWPGGPVSLPGDTATVVERLAGHVEVHYLEAPETGRRVADLEDVRMLERATAAQTGT